MASRDFGAVLKSVQTLFEVGIASALTDDQLLERFLLRGDMAAEVAFAALVERHGPMVLRVCRGVLRDPHAADDAFQATFLILARKAGSIRKRGSVASWLYGVARRAARRAKLQTARREAHERRSAAMAEHETRDWEGPPDLVPEIQEEVDRLPEKYRAPIVLCYLEGLTHEEAASQLRLPVGTVKARLSRARERLRTRLVRRGLVPALIAATRATSARAALSTPLMDRTVKAAMQVVAGQAVSASAAVTALVQGVLRAMFLSHLKTLAALSATALIASLFVLSSLPQPARSDPMPPPPRLQDEAAPRKADEPKGQDDKGRVVIATVRQSTLARTTTQPGALHAAESVSLYPKVSGFLKILEVDIGDHVQKGQLLARIDAPELVVEVAKCRAEVERAQARIANAAAAIPIARSTLEMKMKRRESEDAQLMIASVKEAEAKLMTAEAALKEAEADRKVAEANLRKAEILVGYTEIFAPFDGIVTLRGYHVGDYVRTGDQRGAEPLLRIINTAKMRMVVQVPDSNVPYVDRGDPAVVQIMALGNKRFKGQVSRLAESVDPETRTMRVEIDLDNPEGRLRAGQYGNVTIDLQEHKNLLLIPSSAAFRVRPHDAMACYRVVDGRAVLTRIKTGADDGIQVEIIEGLKEGDRVIANPAEAKINDGQEIKVERGDSEALHS